MQSFQTFRGRDVAEALAAVRAAFGTNALIGSTRMVPNDRGGLFDRAVVEVTAAPPNAERETARETRDSRFSRDVDRKRTPSFASEQPRRHLSQPPNVSIGPAPRTTGGTQESEVEQELRAVRSLLEELTAARKPRDRVISMVQAAGIEGALAMEVASGSGRIARSGTAELRSFIRSRIAERVSVLPSPIEQVGPRVIACIGPTGVGKTTTLAKLAARAHLELGRRVIVVTLDTYRVGAVEQMRRFSELIGVPFSVAHGKHGLAEALAGREIDVVLVDTPSRAPSDGATMRQLDESLDTVADRAVVDVLLAIPASIRAREIERLAPVWETCTPTGIVVTKLDETDQVGGVLHAAVRGPTPFAFLCNGPRVPEDLHSATVEAVVDAVVQPGR